MFRFSFCYFRFYNNSPLATSIFLFRFQILTFTIFQNFFVAFFFFFFFLWLLFLFFFSILFFEKRNLLRREYTLGNNNNLSCEYIHIHKHRQAHSFLLLRDDESSRREMAEYIYIYADFLFLDFLISFRYHLATTLKISISTFSLSFFNLEFEQKKKIYIYLKKASKIVQNLSKT